MCNQEAMKDEKTQKLAAALRDARTQSGMSMEAVSAELGLTMATLSRIETASIGVKADRVAQLAELYGLSVADLLEGRVVNAASKIDMEILHAVVRLVQDVIKELNASPSPDKVADVVLASFQEELEVGSHSIEGLADRQRGKLTLILKS